VPQPNADRQQLITDKGVFGDVIGHRNRDLKIGPDSRLYVGVGSGGNVGIEPPVKATIQSFAPDGADQQTVATGMRNPTGLAFQPGTGALWATVQERDHLGNRLVPDYFTRVVPGGFYGWPYSYLGDNAQPELERAKNGLPPRKVETPDVLFAAHSAAMTPVFYTGTMFPPDMRGSAFVALKGSWNRADPTGYKVVRVPFENGVPTGAYENFMTGFWVSGEDKAEVWGRPADLVVMPDGALLIADDTGGTIWRVTYRSPDQTRADR
jgi:glucose/arabinose dehydrogenase